MLVVDYKSDRLGEAEPAVVVERDYATQRIVYALAALRDGAPAVEVAYAFLERPDAPVSATFTARDVPALAERLTKLAEGVLEGRHPVAAEPHRALCGDCPGRATLCSWPESMTLREPAAPGLADAARQQLRRLGQHERRRAEHLGSLAERATRVSTAAADGRITDSEIARWSGSSSTGPGPRQLAADHDQLRVQHVDDGGHRGADRLARRRRPHAARARRRRWTSSATRGTWTPSESATAAALATVSRQPRLPQRQSAPPSATARTWPSSPAIPSRPR